VRALGVVDGQRFLADVFFADFFAVFFAVDLVPVVFLAAVFLAGDFLAVDFFPVALLAVFLAADPVPVAFLVAFFAVDLAVDRVPVDFLLAFLVAFFAVDFAAPVALAADFLAPEAEAVALAVDFLAAAAATLGSFLSPATTAFSSAPGRNFGTDVFFARTRSPVRGLRTVRAGRFFFSKAPNPVMATFSPRATSRAMVSITASRASEAALRLPSKWAASVSMNWDLFTGFPFVNAVEPAPDSQAR